MNRRQTLMMLAMAPLVARAAETGRVPRVVVYKNESCGCCKL